MSDAPKPSKRMDVMLTVRVPVEVYAFAETEADEESTRTDRNVTKTHVLRDLMREGMRARQARGTVK